VEVRPVPVDDPRVGLAGAGAALHASAALPARAVLAPYASWVTTPEHFDAHVALRQRAVYEEYAVTTETRVSQGGKEEEEEREPLMFVAWPPECHNATAQLNDWRAAPWRDSAAAGADEADEEDAAAGAGGPNCELVRVHGACAHPTTDDDMPCCPCACARFRSWRLCTAAGRTSSCAPRAPCARARS
jgi:hypothetical protein